MKKPRVIMIDNYDSFTYNLVQYLQEMGAVVTTLRNDDLSIADLMNKSCELFVISPGPSTPEHAGLSLQLVEQCAKQARPLFGVCLGHQCIGQYFGGKVVRAQLPMHGKVSAIHHQGQGAFRGLASPLQATRYHSLIVERSSLPPTLQITAETDDAIIMGLKHKTLPIEGVQFHPESVLTETGKQLLHSVLYP